MRDALAGGYESTLAEALHIFKCYKDADVQNFINHKCIDFECRSWATTYLYLNLESLMEGKLHIEGYFSLTHKALLFDSSVSGSLRNKLTGSKKADMQSFVLIGQLGKYMAMQPDNTITASSLSSKVMLDDAVSVIDISSEIITCRNVLIECKSIEKVRSIYLQYGFQDLQFDGELYTMYFKTDADITFPKFPE